MAQPLSAPESLTPARSRAATVIVASAAALTGLLVAGAAVLWAQYGTAVFFEMVKTGIAACI